jgi:hypothetical protein
MGEAPVDLDSPTPLPALPTSPDDAVDITLANNPELASIEAEARAARYDIAVARSERSPTVNAVGSGRYLNALGRADEVAGVPEGTLQNTRSFGAAGVQVRIPFYQGGVVSARVRQAQAFQSQLLERVIATERSVVARTRATFATYRASLDAIRANEVAVAATNIALSGTRAEQEIGTRDFLDVLNAEQELLSSQVALVSARRDAYVSGFALLNAMGQAEARDLNLAINELRDPAAKHHQAKLLRPPSEETANKPPLQPVRVSANAGGDTPVAEQATVPVSADKSSPLPNNRTEALLPVLAEKVLHPQTLPVAKQALSSKPIASKVLASSSPQRARSPGLGKFVAQIGAFSSRAVWNSSWRHLANRYRLQDSQLGHSVTELPDGRQFHRMSIHGFSSRTDANTKCKQIKAQGGACFVRAA